MKCSTAHKLISPYVDGELAERDIKPLEDHMKVCEKCRAHMREMQGLHKLFVHTERFEAPYGFHTRVMANVDVAKTGRHRGISIPLRAAEAVMVIALIAVGMMSGSLLIKGLIPQRAGSEMASLHLDLFQAAPPGTLEGAYLAMTEVRNE